MYKCFEKQEKYLHWFLAQNISPLAIRTIILLVFGFNQVAKCNKNKLLSYCVLKNLPLATRTIVILMFNLEHGNNTLLTKRTIIIFLLFGLENSLLA